MQSVVIRPIGPSESESYIRGMRAKDPEQFLRVPAELALEQAAKQGMILGAFSEPGDKLLCGGVVYDREAESILYCREFGSVFSHLSRYGMMRVIGRPLIVLHRLLDRQGIPLVGVANRNNRKSIEQLAQLYFDSADLELVRQLDDARRLQPETQMFVFNNSHLIQIIDELLELYPEGIVTRSVKPRRRLAVRFELPLLPESLLRAFRASLVEAPSNLIRFPGRVNGKR